MSKDRKHRLDAILRRLQLDGGATVNELARAFGVSGATIRRDVKVLADRGSVVQSVGGKILPDYSTGEMPPSFGNGSRVTNFDKKLRIAEYCTQLVEEHDEIIVGPGTTAFLAGRIFTGISDRRFRIITNSLELAMSASGVSNVESVILGGAVRDNHVIGFPARQGYLSSAHHNHKLVCGADGIDPQYGITLFDQRFLAILQDMVGASREIIITTDSAKLGQVYSNKIADVTAITTIVTDDEAPPGICRELRELGVSVVTV